MSIITELFAKISNREVMRITLKISDTCKNGYDVINLNCDFFSRNERKHEETIEYKGKKFWMDSQYSDKNIILKHFPELEPVLKVKGCDLFGFHSYPIQNTLYHCQREPQFAQELYRLTADEVELFGQLNNLALAKHMHRISKERYANEIDEAVKVIEKLSGEKYEQKEFISHQLENDIVYCITSDVPQKEKKWNLLKGQPKPKKYSIELE